MAAWFWWFDREASIAAAIENFPFIIVGWLDAENGFVDGFALVTTTYIIY